ncbi:hypothetical protein [Phaeovulum sp.]|uniref:hypothetical protein n=1 Tax=Phaeovulum sp. TaxID=2934796 RepID=UPI0039E5CB93
MQQGLAILILAAAFAPAAEASVFAPPKGCQLTLTVQMRQCQVANHYTCADDTPGDRWISYADGSGVFFTSRIDTETRWMESISHETGEIDLLEPRAPDHASFSTLLATGRDDYEFYTQSNYGERRRYAGHDQLTGETVVIDGVPLERATFDLSSYDEAGNFVSRRVGDQYISRDWRMFFSNVETFENAFGDSVKTAQPPVTFSRPGDRGFGNAEPEFDCNVLMTRAPVAPIQPAL